MEIRSCIINNMNARKNRINGYNRDKFIPYILDNTFTFDTYSTDDIETALDFIKREGINLVMINGGDGTLQVTLTQMIKSLPSNKLPIILPLRGGTMNMVANNLGIRKNPVENVKLIMQHIRRYRNGDEKLSTVPMMLLKITDKKHGERYGFTFSNGIAFKLQKLYYATGQPSFQTATTVVTTAIGGYIIGNKKSKSYFEKVKVHIIIDNKPYADGKILIAVASVLKKLILWFKPFYKPERKAIYDFYFLAVSMDPFEIIANVRTLSTGKLLHPKSFNDLAHRVTIQSESGYGIDGELTDDNETDVIIENGPALNFFIVPESIRTNIMGLKFKHWINNDHIINHESIISANADEHPLY